MSTDVKELLNDPLKGTQKAHGILSYLFRHVLLWRKVNWFTWNRRADQWLKKEHNRSDKGNLNKALSAPEFTWPVFKQAIEFLNPIGASLTIRLTWIEGIQSEYRIPIDPLMDEQDEDRKGSKDKSVNTLAKLYRRILEKEKVDKEKWQELLEDYASDPRYGFKSDEARRKTLMGSVDRDLKKNKMSWNVFRKGIIFLAPIREEYVLELRWSQHKGDVSYHQVALTDPVLSQKRQAAE